MTTIDMQDPWQRKMFHLLQLRACLSIQAKTGLRHSKGSIIQLVNREHNQNFRTSKAALAWVEKEINRHKVRRPTPTTLARVEQAAEEVIKEII